ncbi:DinB family protein [Fimbriimonas ginsengisoli]|uniref:DinB-like domain-containing protein n=1 Tax=Fimbriimonas ginsengisoli Gsoil 348 TaxID=661478 RepID=A0A068NMS6_FIMGI|nr:DinB family protein [Fimbriimonas ginsengisoli]AIE84697.1 hypothetical protein OP10G_1329 [Fimbriimonas ginsengisoli Gsoil 348]
MDELWKQSAIDLLDEAYVSPEYEHTWFKDNDPDSSLIPSFRSLTAEDAERKPVVGRNAVAGHAVHLATSLEGAAIAMRGGPYAVDWEKSWEFPRPLTQAAWEEICDRLERAYLDVRGIVAANTDWSNPIYSKSVQALLAHAAYHLGSIRQIAADRLPRA